MEPDRSGGIEPLQQAVQRRAGGQGPRSGVGLSIARPGRAARGMTNREAASELFLSPDTINSHLRHPFTKLGIRSRTGLARLAAEREQT